ncbi:MAG: hypothetical protein JRN59_00340 [Nitrososphaerota archaeon]|nr:hypothetical protein [Nitrososphaerota archaeon]
MEGANKWVKGQRCPKCGGQRGKVIAYNLVTRKSPYGSYQYHRFTHRVELKERRVIQSGPRKGFRYFAKKRKYCYLPVVAVQVVKAPRPASSSPGGRVQKPASSLAERTPSSAKGVRPTAD